MRVAYEACLMVAVKEHVVGGHQDRPTIRDHQLRCFLRAVEVVRARRRVTQRVKCDGKHQLACSGLEIIKRGVKGATTTLHGALHTKHVFEAVTCWRWLQKELCAHA